MAVAVAEVEVVAEEAEAEEVVAEAVEEAVEEAVGVVAEAGNIAAGPYPSA